jgi:hypothetical protein
MDMEKDYLKIFFGVKRPDGAMKQNNARRKSRKVL